MKVVVVVVGWGEGRARKLTVKKAPLKVNAQLQSS
jgi:hypothetical protein